MVISMSAMKSAEISKTFGINQPYEFPGHVMQKPSETGVTAEVGELEKNYTDLGIKVSPEELDELKIFEDFLSLHLRRSLMSSVCCSGQNGSGLTGKRERRSRN
jgi:hypothetical protein